MIPMELLSMLASTVLGGVLSIMAQKSQAEAEKQKMFMQRAEFAAQQVDKAREVTDAFTKNTRRWIALIAVVSILVIPKLRTIYRSINAYLCRLYRNSTGRLVDILN
jgi:nucleoside recognition membrane protein YjiH